MSEPKILLLDEPSLGLAPMLVLGIFNSHVPFPRIIQPPEIGGIALVKPR